MRPAFLLLTAALSAQPPDPTFKASTSLVVVPVTVTSAKGEPIDGLSPASFTLLDNSRPRAFDAEGFIQPVALVVAVQNGANSAAALTKLTRTGSMFGPLIAGESGVLAVVTYSGRVVVRQPFTRDAALAAAAIDGIAPENGAGHMLDAVAEAARLFREGPREHQRVLLLIGETKDRGSAISVTGAASIAQRENISVYALTYSPFLTPFATKHSELQRISEPRERKPNREGQPLPSGNPTFSMLPVFEEIARLGKENTAELLTRQTGGKRGWFLRRGALEEALASIGRELHSRYLLTFSPGEDSGGYHRLEVRVNHPGAVVRSRPGYWLSW